MTNQIQNINYEQLFGSDSGEDEDTDLLRSYFVDLPEFAKFYDKNVPLAIVRGRKGMGKSALLRMLSIKLNDLGSKDIVINTTGNELIGMGEFTSTDQALLENHWKQVICKRICVEIGKQINYALTDNSMSLVEAAEIEGFKGSNMVSALTERVGGLILKFVPGTNSANASTLLKKGTSNPIESLRRFQEEKDRTVWLLIDDIDAKYIDNEANQQRVGAFFSAIRSLAFAVSGLKIRTSVRTDVWRNLRNMEDQDKIRQYVIDIQWKDQTLKSIFAKRILTYLQRQGFSPANSWHTTIHYDKIVEQVFEKYFRWDTQRVEPFIAIKILAGNRPRWMGQLCKLAGRHAANSRIGHDHVTCAMREFGQEKISDIQKEHIHQFSDLPKVLDIFRSGKREYNRYQLVSLIQKYYVEKVRDEVPIVNGYPFIASDQIADFLFQIDFLAAHPSGSHTFLTFADDPEIFLSVENNSNNVMWTINASYRNYLRIL